MKKVESNPLFKERVKKALEGKKVVKVSFEKKEPGDNAEIHIETEDGLKLSLVFNYEAAELEAFFSKGGV